MPGARCTRGLVCKIVRRNAHEHTGSAEASGIPCVMALRLMPCSPRRRIRLVTVVGGFKRLLKPGRAQVCHRRLGTSNGCQDHTVLPYAKTSFVLRACQSLTRLNPPCDINCADALASTTSHPAFVTTRDRPSSRNGMAGDRPLIWGFGEAEICPSCQFVARRRASAGLGAAWGAGVATADQIKNCSPSPGHRN
jgi:hypothetical protein